ncbi:solute carrier family 2, facilitated glucose transporter member 5-like [Diadema antillarum]|uniref:solute carrier family 2, facilitated glucose transporter member 5-like n=1 Tax=Diadema antillarum TaxID=105358 RepID=UPI003A867849
MAKVSDIPLGEEMGRLCPDDNMEKPPESRQTKHMMGFFNESHYHRHEVYLMDHSSTWLWAFVVAIVCVGASVGAIASGYPSNQFGRKKTILGNNIFSVTGAALISWSYFAYSYEMVLVGRFAAGISVGVVSVVIPLYLSEISPTPLRGMILSMHGVLCNIGVAVAQTLGLYVFTGENSWPLLTGIPIAVISLFQVATLSLCPETPRWLLIKRRDRRSATKALQSLRGSKNVTEEIDRIEKTHLGSGGKDAVGIVDILRLRNREWRKPLLITIVCNLCCSMTGANVIWFYLVEIFQTAGLTAGQIGIVTVWIAIVNAIVTFVAGCCLDKFGRRPITILPLCACVVTLSSLTVCILFQDQSPWLPWLSAVLVAVHTFMVSLGPGPTVFILCAEIWDQGPRSAAMALGGQIFWISNFVIGILFPYLQKSMGPYCFLVFASFMAVCVFYFWFELPETKNKTFEEISQAFRREAGLKEKNHVEKIYSKAPSTSSSTDISFEDAVI